MATDGNAKPTAISETPGPDLTTSNICVLVHKKDNNKIEVSHNKHPSRSSENVSPRINGRANDEDDDDILVLRLCEMERVTRHHRNGKTLIRRHSHAASTRSADMSFHTCKSASTRKIRSADSSQHHYHHHHHHRATKKKLNQQNIASTDKQPSAPKQASEIIIVSDEFRRNALKQDVVIARQKNWLKSRINPPKDLHRSMDDVRTAVDNNSELIISSPTNGHSPKKALSKSVDNISFEQNEDDALLENVGSVELVFISTEDLKRSDSRRNHNHNVIVLNELNRSAGQIDPMRRTTADRRKKQLVFVSDDFRRNSLRQNKAVVVMESTKKRRHLKHIKEAAQQNGTASQQTSVDDMGNKITSHAFHSYDEDQEDLERKELHQSIVDDVKQVASVIIAG